MSITYMYDQDYADQPDYEKIAATIADMRFFLSDMETNNLISRSELRDAFAAWKIDYFMRLLRQRE